MRLKCRRLRLRLGWWVSRGHRVLVKMGGLENRPHANAIHRRRPTDEHDEFLNAFQVARALREREVGDDEMGSSVHKEKDAVRAGVIAVEQVIELRQLRRVGVRLAALLESVGGSDVLRLPSRALGMEDGVSARLLELVCGRRALSDVGSRRTLAHDLAAL